jgi:hypothetical protein
MAQLHAVNLHERFLAAVRGGDTGALGTVLAPDCTWAERDYLSDAADGAILELSDAAAAADYFGRWHVRYRPEQVAILYRHATPWFVFAEELWTVRPEGGEPQQFRKAVIYAINPAGQFRATIGYGTDLEAASSAANLSVGQAYWPGSESDGANRTRTPAPM